MVFLRSPFASSHPPLIRGNGVTLRAPEVGDFEQWSSLRMRSRSFLSPWEPLWPPNDLTRRAFRGRVKQYCRDIEDDAAYPFFVFSEDEEILLGAATLSNVRRGVAQTATLGYWIGAPYARQGHMFAGLAALLPYAFGQLSLHRIEAACLPANAASIGLLKKLGFHKEGLARQYLKINGRWQDHLLFARLPG